MDNPILAILITTVGYFFWLWSRGGRYKVSRPREIDEMDQTIHAPAAAPLFLVIAIVLVPLGLYFSFRAGLLVFAISLVIAPLLALVIFRPFWKRF